MPNGPRYTAEETEWLRGWYPAHPVAETVAEHDRLFPSTPRSRASLLTKASQLGLRRDTGAMAFTPEMNGWFREFVPGHEEGEIAAAFELEFGVRLTRSQIKNHKSYLGLRSGTHGGRWTKGQQSWNKGMTWDDFMPKESQERSRAGCFKKGIMPANADGKPIGYLRVSRDGYIEIKVAPRKEPGTNSNFKALHRVLWCWRRHVRKVPDGCNVVFANHDNRDFSPENLVLVRRRDWSALNKHGSSYADADSLMAAEANVQLKREIRRKRS